MDQLPERIDRYHVVGHLAAGGMAEILLGKLLGPAGFDRAVVIKRILPHLCRVTPNAVPMMYDEARLLAAITHDNVVQVTDVGQSDGLVYLVMEYLEGESVAGLMRRLVDLDRFLEPVIAAHVVASACAGLHAAHELHGPDGEPLGVVHRDVSPQNLFVTYAGRVKVLDFGVAKSRDQVERTETGVVKGKVSYMSPEQARGEPLDRRSDVFSLGICLFELLARRRLFRRATAPMTIRALLDGPIPSVRTFRPDVPPRLDEIVLRALARDREARYPSCLAFRRELLSFLSSQPDTALADERLAVLMHELFGARAEEKDAMLGRLRAGEPVQAIPAEIDLDVEVEEVETMQPPIAARPQRWPIVVAAGGALLVLALGTYGVWTQTRSSSVESVETAAVDALDTAPLETAPLETAPRDVAVVPDDEALSPPELPPAAEQEAPTSEVAAIEPPDEPATRRRRRRRLRRHRESPSTPPATEPAPASREPAFRQFH